MSTIGHHNRIAYTLSISRTLPATRERLGRARRTCFRADCSEFSALSVKKRQRRRFASPSGFSVSGSDGAVTNRSQGVHMLQRHLQVAAALLFLTARIALGQAGTADLTGIVSDSAGAVVDTAKVTATDTQTGVSTETSTGTGGVYVFTNL